RELTVIASGGDGDGYAIGMGHTIHSIRRNIDITYIVMDNQIYGLTKGQTSPRSEKGFKNPKSTPMGSIESEIKPLEMALTVGATFVAQSVSSDLKGLVSIIEAGIKHKGFSLINVYSPCVTYNKLNTYDWFKENLTSLDDIEGYDPTDKVMAMTTLMNHNSLVTGIIYQDTTKPSYEDQVRGFKEEALSKQDLDFPRDKFEKLVAEFM
ncbi:MAG: thiamine pyrophosphate-dependent enzyme, partial [Bacilli bacterium]